MKQIAFAAALAVAPLAAAGQEAPVVVREAQPTSEVPTFVATAVISLIFLVLANDY